MFHQKYTVLCVVEKPMPCVAERCIPYVIEKHPSVLLLVIRGLQRLISADVLERKSQPSLLLAINRLQM